jgi:hypothetical protein
MATLDEQITHNGTGAQHPAAWSGGMTENLRVHAQNLPTRLSQKNIPVVRRHCHGREGLRGRDCNR